MTTLDNTTHDHSKVEAAFVQDPRAKSRASKAGRFLLHFLEMLLAMSAGMAIFHFLENLIPASSSLAVVADRETIQHTIVMDLFMVVPMVAWMIVRGHGWKHSVEMAIAMLAPMATVTLLCWLGLDSSLPWLARASGPVMYLGMVVYMLYRRDHFTVRTGRLQHAAHP